MRHSIATVSLSGMLREKLQATAAAGFDGIEIFENDLLQFPGLLREVRQICADLGLTIDLFQPFCDFDSAMAAQLARNLERAERKFDVMHELGNSMILVCSNMHSPKPWATLTSWPNSSLSWPGVPGSAACSSPTRRWPGQPDQALFAGLGRSQVCQPSEPGHDAGQLSLRAGRAPSPRVKPATAAITGLRTRRSAIK